MNIPLNIDFKDILQKLEIFIALASEEVSESISHHFNNARLYQFVKVQYRIKLPIVYLPYFAVESWASSWWEQWLSVIEPFILAHMKLNRQKYKS